MLESQSWKSKIVTKMGKLKRRCYLSKLDYYHHKFDFHNFFSCLVKLWNNLKLKFSSKFNRGLTIIMAIYKKLSEKIYTILTLFTMDFFFGSVQELGRTKKAHFLKCVLHMLQSWNLARGYTLRKEDPKKYKSRYTLHYFCWHQLIDCIDWLHLNT